MNAPKVRRPWERQRTVTPISSETDTVQDTYNDTNVNAVVARYTRSGYLPPAQKPPVYADVTSLQGDLTEAIQRGNEARIELAKIQAAAATQNERENETPTSQNETANEPPAEPAETS